MTTKGIPIQFNKLVGYSTSTDEPGSFGFGSIAIVYNEAIVVL